MTSLLRYRAVIDHRYNIRVAIKKAAYKPKERIPTKPTRGSVLRRLDAKKRLSNKKRERGRRDFD